MQVDIVGISQDVSFEDGSVTNFLSIRLPSNKIVKAVVTDETVRHLIELRLGNPQEVPESSQEMVTEETHYSEQSQQQEDGELAVVFGGSEEASDDQLPPWVQDQEKQYANGVQITEKPTVHTDINKQTKEYQAKQKEQRKKRPSVVRSPPKDDMGYPIVTRPGVDPRDVVGSSATTDEDGIGQI